MKKQTWAILLIFLVACSPVEQLTPNTKVPTETIPAPTVVTLSPTPLSTATASLTPTVNPLLNGNNLYQALSTMPQGTNYVEFTNWSLIKKSEGFEEISSTDDISRRFDFFSTAVKKYYMPSFYGLTRLPDHSQLWGWDSTDLKWEARSSIISPPVYVLKFRDGFDFGLVISSLENHDFERTSYHNISIYSKELDLSFNWIRTTELSILNTAVIENANMLVMSIDQEAVTSIVDILEKRSNSIADREAVQEVILSLGNPVGAFVSGNPCSLLSSQALLKRLAHDPVVDIKQVKEQLNGRPPLQDYEALGVSYSVENSKVLGKIVLQFPDSEKAKNDILVRQELVQTSITRGKKPLPYNQAFFTLSGDASVEGSQVIMQVVPVENRASRLFSMTQLLDMNFATCP